MTNKNTGDTNETAADLPVPNGHSKNGTPATNAATSVKKRKKKRPHAEAKAAAHPAQQKDSGLPSVPTAPTDVSQTKAAEADASTQTATPEVSAEIAPAASTAAPEPAAAAPEPAAAAPEPAAAAPEPAAAAPETAAELAAAAEPAATAAEPAATAPEAEAAAEGLKLRMKIWTDPATAKRYLMPTAFMRDVINGQPVSDVMYAYAMSDEDTQLVTLRAHEWNTLPFSYFQEIGPAPRASERPFDAVPAGPGRRPS